MLKVSKYIFLVITIGLSQYDVGDTISGVDQNTAFDICSGSNQSIFNLADFENQVIFINMAATW